ncbi:beta-ketoacyl synthase N-terminal-like domain-containing protein [Micromonospora sp. DT201]|uniref:beta-ketoacyl synthase N-terminal-like domain-containing protein n=1 Tax=Micromonospora sp. DT201 TaxID=3393442 RepID=UPI003CEA0BD1
MTAVVVVGTGLALGGAPTGADLLSGTRVDQVSFEPAGVLGRKGLRYKDRATHLGLSAAMLALRDAGLADEAGAKAQDGDGIAVIVGSNFGNLDTVAKIMDSLVEDSGSGGLSPMDTPNASSNEVAAAVAIRLGLRGPNLTLCNGAATGIDALSWGRRLLTSGRATQVLVVGVEPDNEVARRMTGGLPLVDGAAAVVLELPDSAADRGVPERARLERVVRATGIEDCLRRLGIDGAASAPQEWFGPEHHVEPAAPSVLPGLLRHDLSQRWGLASAALGVLQCVAAISRFEAGADGPIAAVAGTDADDASSGVLITRPVERA